MRNVSIALAWIIWGERETTCARLWYLANVENRRWAAVCVRLLDALFRYAPKAWGGGANHCHESRIWRD